MVKKILSSVLVFIFAFGMFAVLPAAAGGGYDIAVDSEAAKKSGVSVEYDEKSKTTSVAIITPSDLRAAAFIPDESKMDSWNDSRFLEIAANTKLNEGSGVLSGLSKDKEYRYAWDGRKSGSYSFNGLNLTNLTLNNQIKNKGLKMLSAEELSGFVPDVSINKGKVTLKTGASDITGTDPKYSYIYRAYCVYVCRKGESKSTLVGILTKEDHITITGLKDGEEYYIKVLPCTSKGIKGEGSGIDYYKKHYDGIQYTVVTGDPKKVSYPVKPVSPNRKLTSGIKESESVSVTFDEKRASTPVAAKFSSEDWLFYRTSYIYWRKGKVTDIWNKVNIDYDKDRAPVNKYKAMTVPLTKKINQVVMLYPNNPHYNNPVEADTRREDIPTSHSDIYNVLSSVSVDKGKVTLRIADVDVDNNRWNVRNGVDNAYFSVYIHRVGDKQLTLVAIADYGSYVTIDGLTDGQEYGIAVYQVKDYANPKYYTVTPG